jgi:hypothetical protein
VKQVTRLCDRCGGIAIDQGSVLEVTAGSLRHRFPQPLDLCSDCGGLFAEFIRSGHQTPHIAPGSGIPTQLDGLAIQRAGSV